MDPIGQRRDKRKSPKYVDWLGHTCDSDYGIPRRCPCGEEVTEEVRLMEALDTNPGKRWFTCPKFKKPDGSHIRTPWVYGVSEEIERLHERLEYAESVVHGMETMKNRIEALEAEVQGLKEEVANLNASVGLLEMVSYD